MPTIPLVSVWATPNNGRLHAKLYNFSNTLFAKYELYIKVVVLYDIYNFTVVNLSFEVILMLKYLIHKIL